ncbi:hypothetical protein MMC29_005000 [Sticta canariensis]|nr:hypothetical protein [Sticta canariensis]
MSITEAIQTIYAEKVYRKPLLTSNASKKALEDSSWADGLRGISALFVLSSHMVLAFARYIVRPADGLHGHSSLFQKPFFRLVGQGQAWVALFFILSGFVNALKPVKLAKAGNIETALSNLGVSSFKRSFRLFLPATAITVISWFVCQLGAFETARNSDAYWLYTTSPKQSLCWTDAIKDLLYAIRTTWTYNPDNPYDQPQWALLYLLQGSMFVFTVLLVTINLRSGFRVSALVICYFWSFNWGIKLGDPMVGINVFAGIILVELHHSRLPLRLSPYSHIFAPPLALAGLFLMSFPSQFQPWTYWSSFLLKACHKIAPVDIEVSRYWPTIGAQVLTLAIVLSPHLRRALSHRWLLWLGKISFPLYLLHGSLMRSVLAWMLFHGQTLKNIEENNVIVMRYPLPGIPTFIVAIPVFMAILFVATHFWAVKVEPWFGWMTDKAQKIMFTKEQWPNLGPNGRSRTT